MSSFKVSRSLALLVLAVMPAVQGAPVNSTSIRFGSVSTLKTSEYPVTGCRTNNGTGVYTYCRYGGWGGEPFAYDCPRGETVVRFSGRAQDRLDALQIHCSGGNSSALFGGQGGFPFQGPNAKDNIINFVAVRSANEIDQIAYTDGFGFGGNGGEPYGARSEKGRCPLVGIEGRAGDRISALTFKFSCSSEGRGQSAAYTSPKEWYGGVGGDQFQIFDCPFGSHIQEMRYRSANDMNAMQVMCSDQKRTESPMFGGQGGNPSVLYFSKPVTSFQVRSADRIDALLFANQTAAGGNGGVLADVKPSCKGGMWSGFEVKSNAKIQALAFKFTCPQDVKKEPVDSRVTASAPIDVEPLEESETNNATFASSTPLPAGFVDGILEAIQQNTVVQLN